MSSAHSRRNVLRGISAGAVVVGWSAVTGSWVTAEAASGQASTVAPLPPLDGVLETSPAVLGEFSKDWGGFVTASPKAVLRTSSVQDVVKIVKIATRHRTPIIPYSGGTSLEGQFVGVRALRPPFTPLLLNKCAQSEIGSICVDVSRMDKIIAIHGPFAIVLVSQRL